MKKQEGFLEKQFHAYLYSGVKYLETILQWFMLLNLGFLCFDNDVPNLIVQSAMLNHSQPLIISKKMLLNF